MAVVVYKVGDNYVDPNGNVVDAPKDEPQAAQQGGDSDNATDARIASEQPRPAKRTISAPKDSK